MNCLLLAADSKFKLSGTHPKAQHIKNVLKAKDGDEIFVGNINGKLYICRLSISANFDMEFTPLREVKNPPQKKLTICVSYARPQIAQRLLFEAACFGIENLIFYPASKGEADYAKSALYSKAEYIDWLIKGAEQACATTLPNFFQATSLEDSILKSEELNANRNLLKSAPDVYEATHTLKDFIANNSQNKSTQQTNILIFGSERGFTNSDRQILRQSGFTLVSLGERVLRTDTAIISALAHF